MVDLAVEPLACVDRIIFTARERRLHTRRSGALAVVLPARTYRLAAHRVDPNPPFKFGVAPCSLPPSVGTFAQIPFS